jgi:hypothetical protein
VWEAYMNGSMDKESAAAIHAELQAGRAHPPAYATRGH